VEEKWEIVRKFGPIFDTSKATSGNLDKYVTRRIDALFENQTHGGAGIQTEADEKTSVKCTRH